MPLAAPHAVVSSWLDADHHASAKGYALAPPEKAGPGRLRLVVRLLSPELVGALLAHTRVGTPVRLGAGWYEIAEPARLRRATHVEELAADSRRRRAVTIETDSPMTFRRGGRTSPLPVPATIITSLSRRWKSVLGEDGPRFMPDEAEAVYVRDIAGASELIEVKDTLVSAFHGTVVLATDHAHLAERLRQLLAFASYAGLGSYTAWGLGAVRISDDQPGKRR